MKKNIYILVFHAAFIGGSNVLETNEYTLAQTQNKYTPENIFFHSQVFHSGKSYFYYSCLPGRKFKSLEEVLFINNNELIVFQDHTEKQLIYFSEFCFTHHLFFTNGERAPPAHIVA